MAENKKDNNTEVQEDEEIVMLVDDEGKEVEFKYLATLDYEEEWYLYLQPIENADEDVEEPEIAIMRIETDAAGNDTFVPVEDEELWDKLYDEFVKALEEQEE